MRQALICAALLMPLCGAAMAQDVAKAKLVDLKGIEVGTATLTETPNGVLVHVTVKGVPAGEHAFHIHQVGKCDGATGFKTAGDHFAVGAQKHGFKTEGGPHAGDLPNIFVGESGAAEGEAFDAKVTLKEGPNSVFDGDGSALVVHAKADDHHTQPSGAAGDRIACGVIEK